MQAVIGNLANNGNYAQNQYLEENTLVQLEIDHGQAMPNVRLGTYATNIGISKFSPLYIIEPRLTISASDKIPQLSDEIRIERTQDQALSKAAQER